MEMTLEDGVYNLMGIFLAVTYLGHLAGKVALRSGGFLSENK